jgi:hypothetical protein
MIPLTPTQFVNKSRELGIYMPRCGPDAAAMLQKLIAEPLPLQIGQRDGYGHAVKAPVKMPIGPLIAQGLAMLDGLLYRATQKGVKWIEDLKKNQMIAL